MSDKLYLETLNDGESYTVKESDYGKAEIWLKNDTYFLFEIPIFGGQPSFVQSFHKSSIDEMITTYQSWV